MIDATIIDSKNDTHWYLYFLNGINSLVFNKLVCKWVDKLQRWCDNYPFEKYNYEVLPYYE